MRPHSAPAVMMRAATDSAGTLDNRLITVTGFTMAGDGDTDLGRVVIICCAARRNAPAYTCLAPAAIAAASYPEDTWCGSKVPS